MVICCEESLPTNHGHMSRLLNLVWGAEYDIAF